MKKWIFMALLLIAGCKHDSGGNTQPVDDDDLSSYPFNFDQETPGGIQIETRGHTIPQLYDIDTYYSEVSQCVADGYATLSISGYEFFEGPPVIIENDLSTLCNTSPSNPGVYCVNFVIPFMGLDSSFSGPTFVREWKHEFIHHILYMNDVPTSHNWHKNHVPSEIWDCEWN